MSLHLRLDILIAKTTHLLHTNNKLQLSNINAENELKKLLLQLEDEVNKNAELNNKIKIIKLAQNIGTGDSQNANIIEMKRKLNEYIKEVDQCIIMLND